MEWFKEFFLSGSYTLLEDIPPEQTAMQVGFVINALGLEPGMRLLDVACGIGRHSLALAARGLDVTGLDYTPAYLQRARQNAVDLPVRFTRGDMRRLPFPDSRFDAALNLFTSFGYFDTDNENAGVLREISRVLRPGGLLLLDTLNRDGLTRAFQPRAWHSIPGGYLLEERTWDARRGRVLALWTFLREGEARTYPNSVRAYTCPEMEHMLNAAGMEMAETWGGWDGQPLSLDSRRLIVRAQKR